MEQTQRRAWLELSGLGRYVFLSLGDSQGWLQCWGTERLPGSAWWRPWPPRHPHSWRTCFWLMPSGYLPLVSLEDTTTTWEEKHMASSTLFSLGTSWLGGSWMPSAWSSWCRGAMRSFGWSIIMMCEFILHDPSHYPSKWKIALLIRSARVEWHNEDAHSMESLQNPASWIKKSPKIIGHVG